MFTRKLVPSNAIPPDLQAEMYNSYSNGGDWDKDEAPVKRFKRLLKNDLYEKQGGMCCYCEGDLQDIRQAAIEHIAPKGGAKRPKHTECQFNPLNLALACDLCNETYKGQKDTVMWKGSADYSRWIFNIVHPYLDNPADYFEIVPLDDGRRGKIPIKKVGLQLNAKAKAERTLEMIGFDQAKRLDRFAKEMKIRMEFPSDTEKLISETVLYYKRLDL